MYSSTHANKLSRSPPKWSRNFMYTAKKIWHSLPQRNNIANKQYPNLEGYTVAESKKHNRLEFAIYIKHRLSYQLIQNKY